MTTWENTKAERPYFERSKVLHPVQRNAKQNWQLIVKLSMLAVDSKSTQKLDESFFFPLMAFSSHSVPALKGIAAGKKYLNKG